MPEYCSDDDIRKRLTTVGYAWAADRDRTGVPSKQNIADYITPSIVKAGNIIDFYICSQVTPATARTSTPNPWLKDRCIDIAAREVILIGGGDVPPMLDVLYQETLALLAEVRAGALIPNFTYPAPQNARATSRLPKVANLNVLGRRCKPTYGRY
jgi:hypothetical protein